MLSNVTVTFLVVTLSVYVAIPYLQQYVTPLLVDRQAPPEALPSAPAIPPVKTPALATVGGGAPEVQLEAPESTNPSAFDLLLLQDSLYGTFEEPGVAGARQHDTLSVVVTYRVKPGLGEAFEAAAEALEEIITGVVDEHFIGITIVRPCHGSNAYSTIVQFDQRAAMEEWLVSDARRRYVANGAARGRCSERWARGRSLTLLPRGCAALWTASRGTWPRPQRSSCRTSRRWTC